MTVQIAAKQMTTAQSTGKSNKAPAVTSTKQQQQPSSTFSLLFSLFSFALFAHFLIILFACNPQDNNSVIQQQYYCQNSFVLDYLTPRWVIASRLYDDQSSSSTPLFKRLFTISYPVDPNRTSIFDMYGKGQDDLLFVIGCVLIFSVVQRLGQSGFRLFAERVLKIGDSQPTDNKGPLPERFGEQAYLGCWYTIGFTCCYLVYKNSPYYPLFENSDKMWTDYPAHQVPGYIKLVYLVDGSFWIQQLMQFVFFTAPALRRKDHFEMIAHHIITSTLVFGSYMTHLTRVGNVVSMLFYSADILLCLAKCLKYAGKRFQLVCDITFGLFVLTWIFTRHIVFYYIMWSIWFEGKPDVRPIYDPWFTRSFESADDWQRPGAYINAPVMSFFLLCFAGLQTLLLIWLTMIVKVVVSVVTGKGAVDVREDDD